MKIFCLLNHYITYRNIGHITDFISSKCNKKYLIKIGKTRKQFSTKKHSNIFIILKKHKNYTGEQMPTKKELEKRREKRKQEETEKTLKPMTDELKKDTEIIKKEKEPNKKKKHK